MPEKAIPKFRISGTLTPQGEDKTGARKVIAYKPTPQENGEVNQRIARASRETAGILRIAVLQMGGKAFSAIQLNLRAVRTSQRSTSACSQFSFIAGGGC
jgi:hypothetical protein